MTAGKNAATDTTTDTGTTETSQMAKPGKPGCFFLVVGPSGAGKDSLMDGARQQLPSDQFVFAKRIITRPPGMIGEDYQSCDPATFAQKAKEGAFLMTWQAHGYQYGLDRSLLEQQHQGRHVIANGSRAAVSEMANQVRQLIPNFVVVLVTAPIDVLADRLAKRGRESRSDIKQRLERHVHPLPEEIEVLTVANDASLDEGIKRFTSTITRRAERSKP